MSRIIRAKKEGRGQLSPAATLMLMLAKQAPDGIEEEHLLDLFDQAVATCGSIQGAIQALESGALVMEKIR
jgi:hypothetical protein